MATQIRPAATEARIRPHARFAAQGHVNISSAPAADDAVWDGATITALTKVFLGRQSNPAQSGLYVWIAEGEPLVRHSQMRSGGALFDGLTVSIGEGINGKDSTWRLQTDRPVGGYNLGVTPLVWSRQAAGGGGGGLAAIKSISSADSPYEQLVSDQTLVVDAAAGPVQIDLLALALAAGDLRVTQSDDSGNAITLNAAGAELIRGAGEFVFGDQYASITAHPHPAGGAWYLF